MVFSHSTGCVDIWESKVLRAGAGAHFHAPILNNLTWDDITNFVDPSETTFYAADNSPPSEDMIRSKYISESSDSDIECDSNEDDTDLDSESNKGLMTYTYYYDIDWKKPSALVIGGETHGLSPEAFQLCMDTDGSRVTIPMSQHIESLNNAMAASIILFEAQRQVLGQYSGQYSD